MRSAVRPTRTGCRSGLAAAPASRRSPAGKRSQTGRGEIGSLPCPWRVRARGQEPGDRGQRSSCCRGARQHLERTVRRQLSSARRVCTSRDRPAAGSWRPPASGDSPRSAALRGWAPAVDGGAAAASQDGPLPAPSVGAPGRQRFLRRFYRRR